MIKLEKKINNELENDTIPIFEKKVAICLVINEPFAVFGSVTLQSIIDNTKASCDIFICSDKEFSLSTKTLLENQIQKNDNISLRFLNLSSYVTFENFINIQNIPYPPIVFGRLYMPFILNAFKKIIYLDSDIIVNFDISDLYSIDMQNMCIAGVKDLTMIAWAQDKNNFAAEHINNLGLITIENYINSGFLLFDVDNYNKFINSEDIIKCEHSHKFLWPDQDLINILFENKIFYLESKYNALVSHRDDENIIKSTNRKDLLQKYYESVKNPRIIHFLNCSFLNTMYPCLFFDKYWSVARKTPFYETLILKTLQRQKNDMFNDNFEQLFERASLKNIILIVLKKIKRVIFHERSY